MGGLLSLFMAGRQSVRVAVSYHLAHRRVLPSHTIIANYIFLGLSMCGCFVVSLSAYTPICTLHVLYASVSNQRQSMHGPDVERCAPHPRIQSGPNLLATTYVYPKATSVAFCSICMWLSLLSLPKQTERWTESSGRLSKDNLQIR